MKNSITNRYDKNSNNELVINISAAKVEDLFEDYDKKSTFIKKDLKESLEKYLIQSVEEIQARLEQEKQTLHQLGAELRQALQAELTRIDEAL